MPFPVGVLTRVVAVADPITDFSGVPINGILSITPSLSLKWDETDQILVSNPVQVALVNGVASVSIPVVQSGFVTDYNRKIDAWTYTASVSTAAGGVSIPDLVFVLPYGLATYDLDFSAPADIQGTVVTLLKEVSIGSPGGAGSPGVGVPVAGTLNQVLVKRSGADYDTAWADQTGGSGGSGTLTNLLILGPTEPVPSTTAFGTVIVRRIN